jgi:hypothetical protein
MLIKTTDNNCGSYRLTVEEREFHLKNLNIIANKSLND